MDIEQLKLILETVSAVSGDAVTIAVSYIVVSNLLPFIGWLVAGFGAYKIASKIILAFSDNSFKCEMRDALGIGSHGYMLPREKMAVERKIRELVSAEMLNKKL